MPAGDPSVFASAPGVSSSAPRTLSPSCSDPRRHCSRASPASSSSSRSQSERPNTPIIFHHAATPTCRPPCSAMKAGAIEFLTKPFRRGGVAGGHPDRALESQPGDAAKQHREMKVAARALRLAQRPRTRGHGSESPPGLDEQASRRRAWDQRDHREGPSGPSDAENESRHVARAGKHGHQARHTATGFPSTDVCRSPPRTLATARRERCWTALTVPPVTAKSPSYAFGFDRLADRIRHGFVVGNQVRRLVATTITSEPRRRKGEPFAAVYGVTNPSFVGAIRRIRAG